jgi:4-hydroxy-3-methylbut-2-enyl diphosphate reductase
MKLLRAEHLGMCFGVRDAIALARTEAARQPVTVLGELVHNETVLADLRSHGIRLERDLTAVTTPTVLITAHGTSERRLAEVRERGHRVIEATCPLVHVAHRALAELVARGLHPVVIGQRGHVEVQGLTGDYPDCDVVLSESDIDALTSRPRFGVVAQTTQPIGRVRELVAHLRARFPASEVVFRDTVCQPTKQRQSAAEELAQRCDVVVVIGGANSNNTRQLVATCRHFCERVHHVQTAGDLCEEWFQADDTVGVTAGTSTPDSTIQAVEAALRRMELGSTSRESLTNLATQRVAPPVAGASCQCS